MPAPCRMHLGMLCHHSQGSEWAGGHPWNILGSPPLAELGRSALSTGWAPSPPRWCHGWDGDFQRLRPAVPSPPEQQKPGQTPVCSVPWGFLHSQRVFLAQPCPVRPVALAWHHHGAPQLRHRSCLCSKQLIRARSFGLWFLGAFLELLL